MKGIVCGLSPARLRILEDDPEIAHDLADRSVEVPGRHFFDALRMPERLRSWLPPSSRFIAECLEGRVGRGVGERSGWAFGRPHVIEGGDLERLGAELEKLEPRDDEDTPFLARFTELVRQELARGGSLLVFVT